MEGLIPMVFRSFKKSRTRQQYSPLSAPASQTYNIADFYPNGYNHQKIDGSRAAGTNKFGQRNKSFSRVEYAGGRYTPEDSVKPGKQLVRFRSHRRMFSCISGA